MGWFNVLLEKLKKKICRESKGKLVENCVIALIIGVILIIAGGTLFGRDSTGAKGSNVVELRGVGGVEEETKVGKVSKVNTLEVIKEELEGILCKIKGAGRVNVMITYEDSKEFIPAYDVKKSSNSTCEKDTGGGVRNVSQEEFENRVVYEDVEGGGKKAVILKELLPKVKGVLVVADGASNVSVREALTRAVEVLTDIPICKVQVFERTK